MIPLRNAKRFLFKAYNQPCYALKVFKKRLMAYLYYYLSNGKSSYPEAVTLFLTHRCNLHCKMCGQWGEGGVTRKQSAEYIREELSFDELKMVIDDLSPFGPNITLFGGEPLIYKNSIDTIKYIKNKNMHCLMITNGSLIEPKAQELVDAGLDELNVSLDGGRELHNEIRGMDGLFDRVLNGLKKINHFKKEKNKKRPFINLQCTITKYNYENLEQLLNAAEETGADSLTFHNLIFLENGLIEKQKKYDKLLNCSSLDWKGFISVPDIDVSILFNKMEEIKKKVTEMAEKGFDLKVDFYPNFSKKGLFEYYQNPLFLPREYSPRCVSPWISAYIFPDGETRPCLNFDYSFGNIKKDKFTLIWNGERARNFRKTLKRNKIFPVCIRCTELYRY
ncbi:MAG: radical SAM protein [bacterium]